MKWIGQHIWDFISRFRSKVYLEDVDNAGSDTDAFLVKKADGEIAIRTGAEVLSDIGASSESTDLEFNGSTANGVLTYGGAAQIDVESGMTFDGDILNLYNTSTGKPTLQLSNNNADDEGSLIQFVKMQNGAADDEIGHIQFVADNNLGTPGVFGEIRTFIQDATDGAEEGKMAMYVASHDQEQQPGLQIYSGNAEDEVDVTIGNGATSLTTIAGTLTMGSTAAMTNAGLLSVANQSNITGLGTISSGTWEATDIGVAHGGTGASSLTDNSILTGTGTSPITAEANLTFDGKTMLVNADTSGDSAEDLTGLHIDFDRTVASSGTAAHNDIGIDLDVNSASLGSSTVKGMDINVIGATSGIHLADGIDMRVSGADQNIGLKITVPDGTPDHHIKLIAADDTNDYTHIDVANGGELTVETVGNTANLILDIGGDIELNADGGDINFKDDSKALATIGNQPSTIVQAGEITVMSRKY